MASLLQHSPPFTVLMEPSAPTHQPISRLAQMQARYQQRQLQEKEQKLLQMLEDQQQRTIQRVSGRGSAGSNTSSGSGSSTTSQGRVRQMFEERRSTHSLSSSSSSMSSSKSSMMSEIKSMGWDRSYPLDPLKPKTGATKAVKPPAQRASSLQGSNISVRAAAAATAAARPARAPLQDSSNGPNAFGKLSNVGGLRNGVPTEAEISEQQQHQVMSKKPVVKALAEPKIKVAPLKRAEAPRARPAPAAATPAVTSPVKSPVKSVSPPIAAVLKPKKVQSAAASTATEKVTYTDPCPAGMTECHLCGRRFNEDRIAKHEDICRKTKQKKRKAFDPVKMRTQGTEAEGFVKSAGKRVAAQPKKAAAIAASAGKSSNWRKKHEDFIETIREARKVKAIMDAGGKLSDLPPPKPMDTSDYVQCPHCQRRFSEGAAERHIPRCASIKCNKPAATKRK